MSSKPEDVDTMEYQQLRSECKKHKLGANGGKETLRSRLRAFFSSFASISGSNNAGTSASVNTEAQTSAKKNSKPSSKKVEKASSGTSTSNAPDTKLAAKQAAKEDKKRLPAKRSISLPQGPASKRLKRSLEDDLMCPITLELPDDPVTAEDGRVYERSAIVDFMAKTKGKFFVSPMTKKKIGKKLLPAVQHKSVIETLKRQGTLEGREEEESKELAQQKRSMLDLMKKANNGDVDAMVKVGVGYKNGSGGFNSDSKEAHKWLQKAHEAKNLDGTAALGDLMCQSSSKNHQTKGIMLTTMAAERGSLLAAFNLGMANANGLYGLPKDTKEAVHWLELSVGAGSSLDLPAKNRAQQKLAELNVVYI